MELSELYKRKTYSIDTDNFYLVKITEDNSSWTKGRVGEIYVTFKYYMFQGCVAFPQLLIDVRNTKNGTPIIRLSSITNLYGETEKASGKILKTGVVFQRPVNWDDYLAIKESNPGEISIEYASSYNNSLYSIE